jgi:hypothetical protein
MAIGEFPKQPKQPKPTHTHTMIELKEDELRFTFPTIVQELKSLAEAYIAQKLPAILAQDRIASLRAEATRDDREKALRLSDDDIARTFRNEVMRFCDDDDDPLGQLGIEFQRTLRIPDDGRDYFLPPGLGQFPLRHIDDFGDRVPPSWIERGGVMMPLYQSEALWLNFDGSYPFALKVASGKINAVTGQAWQVGLHRHPQDYLALPEQPWLDGFAVEKGIIRQFVAMPLGAGYSVEEQLSGKAEFGGIQLQVYPIKARIYFQTEVLPSLPKTLADILKILFPVPSRNFFSMQRSSCLHEDSSSMGLGMGGRMKQEIYADPHKPDDWDLETSSRCFVHLCDALVWRQITGTHPPHTPVTAKEYEKAGLPWFDFYRDDVAVLEGSKTLNSVKSVVQIATEKGHAAISGNDPVDVGTPVHCGLKERPQKVREWDEP